MSYCTKCGKQNPDTAKFCTGCGTTLIITPPIVINSLKEQNTEQKDSANSIWNTPVEKKFNLTRVVIITLALIVFIIICISFF